MLTMEDIYERLWRVADPSVTNEVMVASREFIDLLDDSGLSTERQFAISDACTKATTAAEKMGFEAGFRIASQLCRLMGGDNHGKTL